MKCDSRINSIKEILRLNFFENMCSCHMTVKILESAKRKLKFSKTVRVDRAYKAIKKFIKGYNLKMYHSQVSTVRKFVGSGGKIYLI